MISILARNEFPQQHSRTHIRDAAPHQPHVLVIEPDWSVQQLCKDALESIGVSVSVTGRVAEARTIIARGGIDLAYVALVPDGERESEAFAGFAADRGVHVVLMSGHAKGIEAGIKGTFPFLKKPFRLRDMFRPLIHAIGDMVTG